MERREHAPPYEQLYQQQAFLAGEGYPIAEIPLLPGESSLLWDVQPDATMQQEVMTEPLPLLQPWPEPCTPPAEEQDTQTEPKQWGIVQEATTITVFDAATHNQSDPDGTLPEDVPLLSSRDQYISELWRTERLSPEAEQQIEARARNGDKEARNTLIENCLVYVLHIAKVYSVYVEHDDLLDIAQVGNLAITEKFDQALEKATGSVTAYLFGVAKRTISRYCLYHSRLIPIKYHRMPLEEFPQVTSLDAFRQDADDDAIPFQIPEPEQTTPQETDQERCAKVRQALAELTPIQREVVEMRHGFHDAGSLRLEDIASHLAIPETTIYKRYYRAMKHLKKLLPTWESSNAPIN